MPQNHDETQPDSTTNPNIETTHLSQPDGPLKHGAEIYRTLARNLPGTYIFLFDQDMRFLAAEGKDLARTGFTPENLVGKTLHEVLSAEQVTVMEPLYRAALAGETLVREQPSGRVIYRLHVFPVRNEKGDIFAGMAVAQDITQFRHTERELRNKEQHIRAMVQAQPDMLFVIDHQGTYVEIEMNAGESNPLMGSDYIIGANLRDVGLPQTVVRQTFSAIQATLTTGSVQTINYELPLSSGQVGWFEARIVPLNKHEVLCIVRDISDLRRTQQELKQQLEQLTILTEVEAELADQLNIDYVLTMALDALVRLSKADAGFIGLLDDEGGIELARVVGDYPLKSVEAFLRRGMGIVAQVIQQQEAIYITEIDNDTNHVELMPNAAAQIVIPLISQDHLIGILNLETRKAEDFGEQTFAFLKLLTARIAVAIDNARLYRQTADQLNELQSLYRRVSKLEQLKTDMIRIASHDLRNPLGSLMGFVDMLGREMKDSDHATQLEYLELIRNSARRMRKITTDILSLERIEAAAEAASFSDLDFHDLVSQVYTEQRASAWMKSQRIDTALAEGPLQIQGDPVQLHEAVSNLISNAIKYTPEEGRIQIRLQHADDTLVFEVEDNGIGIRKVHQERLFQPFFRAKTAEVRDIEGTGLGLHLVKNIIERHGGKMHFTSEHGKGSTFGFTLPRNPENA